ncbi:MAG: repeat, subgroup [Ilumatobacteraceae bacterium]|nr:repeat, subgroup [Ilumatobacteraceae bacterium]
MPTWVLAIDFGTSEWDAADGTLVATFAGHSDALFSARFDPTGTRIVTASADHTARIWQG